MNKKQLQDFLIDEAEYDEEDVLSWDAYELIDRWLRYEGIIGWTDDIISTVKGKLTALKIAKSVMSSFAGGSGDKDKKDKGASVAGFKLNKTMLEMAKGFTVKRIISMVGGGLTKEQILDINAQLDKIKKREK